MFPYENWKVYKLAQELWSIALELSKNPPKGCANELDHLRRAGSSAKFNLGEGALRTEKGMKLHFYDISRGSVGEYNAALLALLDYHENTALITHAMQVANHCAALITRLIDRTRENYT